MRETKMQNSKWDTNGTRADTNQHPDQSKFSPKNKFMIDSVSLGADSEAPKSWPKIPEGFEKLMNQKHKTVTNDEVK